MNGLVWAAFGIVAGLLLPIFYLRWRQRTAEEPAAFPPVPPPARRQPARNYHGVSVKPCENACDAVQAILGERYLSSEAPPLPVPGCDQKQCTCTYGHYSDRRDTEDRRTGWGSSDGVVPADVDSNRRDKGRDRRR